MNADGTGARQVSTAKGFDSLPSWSPDGRRLAFHRCVEQRCTLWLVNADSSNEGPLLATEDDTRWPAWSPDGNWIAFTKTVGTKASDIWIIRPDSKDEQRVTRWPGPDEGATWNPKLLEGRTPPLAEQR